MTELVQNEAEAITPYSMHVSLRYLELTKKKLELTRLPRELELPGHRTWEHGTPKAVLEPLLDFWLEGYDWRAAETQFNTSLPQFRTSVTILSATDKSATHSLRIHFVHKRSKHTNAIPLLVCHSWPSSFIEVQRIIDALTDPQSQPGCGEGAQQAFHVIAPSIPGFGFSDASSSLDFGLKETASMFDGLMKRLGYEYYVAHGVGWGFSICRALAQQHPRHCHAVHTANPSFAEPTAKRNTMAFLKYKIAKLTKGKLPLLSFGYLPAELQSCRTIEDLSTPRNPFHSKQPLGTALHQLYSLRPQTLSFSLCDSPVGLLAALLDVIHTRAPSSSPLTSRSRSPFLSLTELEVQNQALPGHSGNHSSFAERPYGTTARDDGAEARSYTWTPTEILNWTMMQWLPGPESSLRWLRQAHLDTTVPDWDDCCPVPLAISSFQTQSSLPSTPLMWGSTSWQIEWVKRHQRCATLPAWEAADLLVLDLRECFGTFMSHGKLANLPVTASTA
ncbi:hypothetical protein HBH98_103660 [Parastagonospora nodorum]|nr:hypothetical protein HBH51_197260 [Parastagonospora nodorum]KAH4033691.1 hypothetical protein HBI09_111710 [Parastagonospora nodorum]KAH4222584.1 hypothetical protein HBI06_141890 [Parastagonospora nodorum]KAH4240318.1 hypothetical protein HBI05_106840 [Parastagonospora nodorum]KAH4346319.1 hypothetical protein HBH98_103660 [Parastagonospora nodorum]